MEQSLDGPLPKWYPAFALSRQDGHHSAVALLLKAALIQVSDYRLMGASGCISNQQKIFLRTIQGTFQPNLLSTSSLISDLNMLNLFYDGSNLEFPINTQKHIFCKGPSNEYCTQVCFQMGLWFKIGVILQYFSHRVLCEIYLDMVAILDFRLTQKRTRIKIQETT